MSLQPITERTNELTLNLDVESSEGIVRLLRACDAQLFSGFEDYPGMLDKEVAGVVDAAATLASQLLMHPEECAIVLAGAGTSGRLAFLAARSFNLLLARHARPQCFHYLIAGGDDALLEAQEGAEDAAAAGVRDLERLEQQQQHAVGAMAKRIFYVGISCGLSATYVAAQLQYAMEHRARYAAAALIGFNPVSMARQVQVPSFGRTFFQVAAELQQRSRAQQQQQRYFIITPVLGPEAVCGSTRMKGGTATKMLLEAIFARALAVALPLLPPRHPPAPPGAGAGAGAACGLARTAVHVGATPVPPYAEMMRAYESVYAAAHEPLADVAGVMEMAAACLAAGGHISYLAADSAAVLALIDASEQVPTFGAQPSDVRAFVLGPWLASTPAARPPGPGSDSSTAGVDTAAAAAVAGTSGGETVGGSREGDQAGLRFNAVSVARFMLHVLPAARSCDLVILLDPDSTRTDPQFAEVLEAVAAHKKKASFQLAVVEVQLEASPTASRTAGAGDLQPALSKLRHPGRPRPSLLEAWGRSSEAIASLDVNALIRVKLPFSPALASPFYSTLLEGLALKFVLNVLSTGAHVLVGKVYRSQMIDVRISNHKLYHRAVGIVARVAGVGPERASSALLHAVYGTSAEVHALDERVGGAHVDESKLQHLKRLDASVHVKVACKLDRVVPKAILMAVRSCSWGEACRILEEGKGLRTALTGRVHFPKT
eukprot:jgi/Mesen1/9142/ME000058S08635